MCSEKKDEPQTLRAVMGPIAAPFSLLTELVGPPSCSSARPPTVTVVSVTTVFPGDGSLSTTHAPDLEGCQPGLHNRVNQSPPRPAQVGSDCGDGHPRQASAAPAASTTRAVCVQGARAAPRAVPTGRCTAVLCSPHSTWHMRLPSLDPFFFAES